jgi:hypothetical protein
MLGDHFDKNWEKHWDEVWTKSGQDFGPNPNTVHILVTLNAQMDDRTGAAVPELQTKSSEINELSSTTEDTRLLKGHNQPRQTAQP